MRTYSSLTPSVPRRPAGQHIDIGVRRVVLYQSEILRYDPVQIAVSTDLPLRSVQLILQRWTAMRKVINDPRKERTGPKAAIGSEARRVCKYA
jgi:hypothetical protein